MEWINFYGIIIIAVMLVCGIIFPTKNNKEKDSQISKALFLFEQIGRYGSMLFMIINIPFLVHNTDNNFANIFYIVFSSLLLCAYIAVTIINYFKHMPVLFLLLAIIPSILFVVCGIIFFYIPLVVTALIFSITHIYITYHNFVKR